MSDCDSVLIVEDAASLRLMYETVLRRAGHTTLSAGTGAAAMEAFRAKRPGVVVLDLMLPDRDGIELIAELLGADHAPNVVVITANGSITRAVAAMRAGAHDFLVKPFDTQRLIDAVANARRARRTAPVPARSLPDNTAPVGAFIGSDASMRAVYGRIRSVARSMATVFITGESGTGKELCAQAVHDESDRADKPFIALNCGAIPADLLESEVFGHLRGSFTGAVSDKPGAAAEADGGTLFLDEICEMDLALQTKLLRFLQTSTIHPVGAARPRKVNARIICATNRDPLEAVRRGDLREDLYYRLHDVPVHLPPLRARGEDVVEIARHELSRLSQEEGRNFTGLAPDVADMFRAHPWPGNVRQLVNVLRNVVVLNDGAQVIPDMLPAEFRDSPKGEAVAQASPAAGTGDEAAIGNLVGRSLAEIEKLVIEGTIAHYGGSIPKAARVLDVSPSTLYRKREAWMRDRTAAE